MTLAASASLGPTTAVALVADYKLWATLLMQVHELDSAPFHEYTRADDMTADHSSPVS